MLRLISALFVVVTLAAPASAAKCGGDFNTFIAGMARDAQAAGVSRAVIDQAFAGVTPDQSVLAFDRRQRGMFHAKSFEEYAATRVIPARLVGRKGSGGKVELLLCESLDGGLGRRWRALGQASKPIRAGAELSFDGLTARVDAAEGEGFYLVTLDREGPALEAALARAGRIPLPPYIRRAPGDEDAVRYQTIWARAPGSAAAPTAGLHFTQALLDALDARGVLRTTVTLHVGPGTFLPVRTEEVAQHRMHEERYHVPAEAAAAFEACRASAEASSIVSAARTERKASVLATSDRVNSRVSRWDGALDVFWTAKAGSTSESKPRSGAPRPPLRRSRRCRTSRSA